MDITNMNTKLFKKLNERMDITNIKSNINISEAEEMAFIFDTDNQGFRKTLDEANRRDWLAAQRMANYGLTPSEMKTRRANEYEDERAYRKNLRDDDRQNRKDLFKWKREDEKNERNDRKQAIADAKQAEADAKEAEEDEKEAAEAAEKQRKKDARDEYDKCVKNIERSCDFADAKSRLVSLYNDYKTLSVKPGRTVDDIDKMSDDKHEIKEIIDEVSTAYADLDDLNSDPEYSFMKRYEKVLNFSGFPRSYLDKYAI